jgi:serine protease
VTAAVALACVAFASSAAAANKAPQLAGALPAASATEGAPFVYSFPAFIDPEGGVVTYRASGQPSWLAFDPATRAFRGTPPFTETVAGKYRKYKVKVYATDPLGKAKSKSFTLKVADAASTPPPPPQPPPPATTLTLAKPIPDEFADEDMGYTFLIPAGTFVHSTGGAIAYAFSGLPPGTHEVFGGGAGYGFAFTPRSTDIGSVQVTVTATAAGGLTASDTFTLTIKGVNDAPTTTAQAPIDLQATEDVPFSFVLPDGLFADEENDPLTLSVEGNWNGLEYRFDPATRTLSGVAHDSHWFPVPADLYFVARDPGGLGVSVWLRLGVTAVDDLPVLRQAVPDKYLPSGRSLFYDVRSYFLDPDDQLSFTYTGIPAWVFQTHPELMGMPGPGDGGVYLIGVTASDGKGHEVSDEFTITVAADNHAPVAPRFEIVGADALVGQPYAFTLPDGAFDDPDSDALTISKTGGASWLAFDPATRAFSGTPPSDDPPYAYANLRATDPGGATADAILRVFIKLDENSLPPLRRVSGRIIAQPNSAVDSDTNDPDSPFASNNLPSEAQSIGFKPALISGYASRDASGTPHTRDQISGDPWDTYRMTLATGEPVTLQISDHLGTPNSPVDLDLFLEDPISGELRAFSIGVGPGEQVVAPYAGEFNIVVNAFSGASNYLLSVGAGGSPAMLGPTLDDRAEFVPGEAIVRYRDARDGSRKGARGGAPRLVPLDPRSMRGLAAKARVPELAAWRDRPIADAALAERFATARAIKLLALEPGVASADPNYLLKPLAEPDDPLYPQQWHLRQINLPRAWDLTRGGPEVIVAVVDTGVVLAHPDLAPNLVAGYDFISSAARARDGDGIDPNPDDPGDGALLGDSSFHGTHVAGTIAAATDNGIGVAGVAGGSRIMPVRALGKGGGTSYDVIQAVRFAAGLSNDSGTVPARRADVINLSLGGGGFSSAENEVYAEVRASGTIVVAAAGNESSELPSYPASYDGVISVSAVDQRRELARYSNRGPRVDLAAPGGDVAADADHDGYPDGVLSTLAVSGPSGPQPTYNYYNGTSMAAPHVAGVVALMRSVLPTLSPEQFELELQGGALTDDLGGDGATVRNDRFGYGLINAAKAVARAQEIANTPSPPSIVVVEPQSLWLPFGVAEGQVTVRRLNGGTSRITAVTTSHAALSVAPFGVDASGFGSYRVSVDRASLTQGRYLMSIDFDTDGAGRTRAWVEVEVAPPVTLQFDNGLHYVLLVDPNTYAAVAQASVTAIDGIYDYEISAPAGTYYLVLGTDHDSDLYICDPGEACGAYPSLSVLGEVVVGDADQTLPDLTTGVQQSVGAQLASPAVQSRTPTGLLRRPPAE